MKRLLLALALAWPIGADSQAQGPEACAGCHGVRGEGNQAMGAPRIAGQPHAYLERQLAAYADGRRENQVMTPIAKGLAPEARSALAAHYAELVVPAAKPAASASAGASGSNARGRTLATQGDDALRVQACENCHGPGGTGQHSLNPYLSGLGVKYLETALREWKDGTRKTDPSQQMTQIGNNLRDEDIRALATWYGTRPPPLASTSSSKKEDTAKKKGAAPTRAGAGTTPTEGAGVTGGEATSGGSQGPGGGGAATGAGPSGSRSGATPSSKDKK